MNIIDLHCDALLKLWEGKGDLSFRDEEKLDTNLERLKKGKVKIQCFAIFIPPELKAEEQFQVALDQVDYFYTEVIGRNEEMKHIKDWESIYSLQAHEIGAILTLEGVDCIGNDLHKLRILYHLGVRSVGLTWNFANLAADGVGEPRGAGLTSFGKEIVALNNTYHVLTDVSHLAEKGFWEVMELADYPIASHSNSKSICPHRRNLTDQQALALFQKNGIIHVVYHPAFTSSKNTATIADLLRHIDHFCSLGGVKQIGLGSDFDGIDEYIIGLENASKHQDLINELLKYYSEEDVKGFAGRNFLEHLPV
ncbi:dipeptidase [Lederbergia sp. NSJ-179]|uniref:dipeptidase n=1 Tax=Lederbergia sp. NSJ-179 TaxID=2931402 RepID=UPI001FD094BC|nr:dipeptidase [Lederbergia sp. NSJ-179]MCJ7840442.1 dipeptidase [Lederbergia sp. NSJ-179]